MGTALQPLSYPMLHPLGTTFPTHCLPSWMLSSYTFMCITNVVLFLSTTDPEPSALLHVPIFSDTWSAHHSLSPGATGGNKNLGRPFPQPPAEVIRLEGAEGSLQQIHHHPARCAQHAPLPSLLPSKPSPMMASAVALPSWLLMVSMTSSPLPSRLQRLIV